MATTARISEATREKVREAWPDILSALAEGSPVSKAIEKHGISYYTMTAFLHSEPDARGEWETAKEVSAEVLFDDLLKLTTSRFEGIDPTRARATMDSLKWLAAKRNPKVYSDRSQVDVNVKTIDLTKIIQEAHKRLADGRKALQTGRVIDAPVTLDALPILETQAQEALERVERHGNEALGTSGS